MTPVAADIPNPPTVVIAIPSSGSPTGRSRILPTVVQIGHRAGIVGFLLAVATIALACLNRDFDAALAGTLAVADVGFCAALTALSCVVGGGPARREALGVLGLNLVLVTLSGLTMSVARADVIRSDVQRSGAAVRAKVVEFFTPPPALPPQE